MLKKYRSKTTKLSRRRASSKFSLKLKEEGNKDMNDKLLGINNEYDGVEECFNKDDERPNVIDNGFSGG